MCMYIYLNFASQFQCIVHVLLGDANKKSIQRKFLKHSYL